MIEDDLRREAGAEWAGGGGGGGGATYIYKVTPNLSVCCFLTVWLHLCDTSYGCSVHAVWQKNVCRHTEAIHHCLILFQSPVYVESTFKPMY